MKLRFTALALVCITVFAAGAQTKRAKVPDAPAPAAPVPQKQDEEYTRLIKE